MIRHDRRGEEVHTRKDGPNSGGSVEFADNKRIVLEGLKETKKIEGRKKIESESTGERVKGGKIQGTPTTRTRHFLRMFG